MGWQPAPIVGGAYADDNRPYSSQDCVNYIPEKADVSGGRSQDILRGLPGLTALATCGTGPIRGLHNVEGNLFCVSGSQLFQIATNGTATLRGTLTGGTSRVGMEHNQVAGGNQLSIGAGTSGYVWNTATQTFTQITDPGFPGTNVWRYVDSYMVGVEPFGHYWFTSNLADATNYNTLNQYAAEADPDLIQDVIINHREVWVLGQRTIEPFDNAGTATTTFQRANGIVIEQGVASKYCSVQLDNTVLFFGNDGIFYRANGYTPMRISTHAIEQAVRGLDWTQCFAFTWTDGGHKVVYWTFPDGHTWGYDIATGLWHRRESHRLKRWRVSSLVYWNGMWIAGDYELGKLYRLDWTNYTEDGVELVATRTTGVVHANDEQLTVEGFQITCDTGKGAINADHVVELTYSDNGGYDWVKWKARSLGPMGAYGKRIRWLRLGKTYERVGRIRISSPVKRDIIAASIKIGGATE